MGGVVDLRAKGYEAIKEISITRSNDNQAKVELAEIVDNVVEYLLKEQPKLILDIENNIIPRRNMDIEIEKYIKSNNIFLNEANSLEDLVQAVNQYIWGYAYIHKYIERKDVSDISINDLNDTWIKVNGKRIKTDIVFPSYKSLENFAYAVCIKNNGNLSKVEPIQVLSDSKTSKDFKLRINVGRQPVNLYSPHISIRKLPKIMPTLEELENVDMINSEIEEYLNKGTIAGLNYVLCGKGGSGKSTLFNAILECVPEDESKLMIEEADEHTFTKKNWKIQIVQRKKGESEVDLSEEKLTKNALLMDLDRIYISESKGGESFYLFDAGFTGHIVGTTLHAPSSIKAVDKLVLNMKKSGTDYTREELMEMLDVLDVIIFMKNYKVCEITEIVGYDYEKKDLIYNPVFEFRIDKKVDGKLIGEFVKLNDSCSKIKNKLKIAGF